MKLSATTTKSVISAMMPIFARYGIPDVIISNNGPQYSSQEFGEFTKNFNFKHVTSSPHHPQGNGEAERAVKTVKKLLKGNTDPNLALLAYRSIPLSWCQSSPAQLLMGRQIRSTVPMSAKLLNPKWPDLQKFRNSGEQFKQAQKCNFDKRHRATNLPEFESDDTVFIATRPGTNPSPGTIVQSTRDWSYAPSGVVRRNRCHLHSRPEEFPMAPMTVDRSESSVVPAQSPVATRTRTGTAIHPPDRLNL